MAAVVIASAIGAYVWSNAYRYELHEFTNRRVTEYYKLDRRTGRVWHIKDGAESEIASLQRNAVHDVPATGTPNRIRSVLPLSRLLLGDQAANMEDSEIVRQYISRRYPGERVADEDLRHYVPEIEAFAFEKLAEVLAQANVADSTTDHE